MGTTIKLWFKYHKNKIVNSIAFYPALIVLAFLVLSVLSIMFDFSETGMQLKSHFQRFSLRDTSAARSIISSITAGIFTLTVFSFSMVMIVLNQTASQLSNRILDRLIGSRFQQVVLGVYVGTIIYSLFLLGTIREMGQEVQIPVLSTYLLVLLTVFDIFLFISFLHFITQSVKYEVIIQRVLEETETSLEDACKLEQAPSESMSLKSDYLIMAAKSGIYLGFDKRVLLRICTDNDCVLQLTQTRGTFVLADAPIAKADKKLPDHIIKAIQKEVYLQSSDSIDANFFFGCRQLTEMALKALSPGINDPGTAIESMRALFQLYAYRVRFFPENTLRNKELQVKIILKNLSFNQLVEDTLYPIWDYGKNDRLIQNELHHLLENFLLAAPDATIARSLLRTVELKMNGSSY